MDKRATREQRDEKSSPLICGEIRITAWPNSYYVTAKPHSPKSTWSIVSAAFVACNGAKCHVQRCSAACNLIMYVLLMIMDADATNSYFTYQGLLPETTHHVPTNNNNARDLRCFFAADPAQNRSLHKTYRTEIIVSRRIPVIVYARSYRRTNRTSILNSRLNAIKQQLIFSSSQLQKCSPTPRGISSPDPPLSPRVSPRPPSDEPALLGQTSLLGEYSEVPPREAICPSDVMLIFFGHCVVLLTPFLVSLKSSRLTNLPRRSILVSVSLLLHLHLSFSASL